MKYIDAVLLLPLLTLVPMKALGEREWPDRVFDCEVETASGAQGLVSLQSLSLEQAQKGAVGQKAITLLGNRDMASRVIQCIDTGTDSVFIDSSFQAWFENLDQ